MNFPAVVRKGFYLSLTFLVLVICNIYSSNEYTSRRGDGLQFIPNKGQVIDAAGSLRPDLLYVGESSSYSIYVNKSGISYVLNKVDENIPGDGDTLPLSVYLEKLGKGRVEQRNALVRSHRFDLQFVGASDAATFEERDQTEGYSNFYYAHCKQGITNVNSYNKLIQKNIYKGIDVVYHGDKQMGLKYDMIVHTGAEVKNIRLKYSGAEINLHDGKLQIETSLGQLQEFIPKVYQQIGNKIKDVSADYVINDDGTVRFDIGKYDSRYDLVIDPWITYYGGNNSDYSAGINVDAVGNVYVAGHTISPNFPVTVGAFQTQVKGIYDMFLVKFDAAGVRQWSTLYGGNHYEYPEDFTIDINGDVFVAGWTSSPDLPLAAGAFQPARASTEDAFIVKFSAAGLRIWDTYFGGDDYDKAQDVTTDALGNVIFTGMTASTTFPTLTPFQGANAGSLDVIVVKFNGTGTLQWSTYYGDLLEEGGNGVATDAAGNIFVTGFTTSLNFPTFTPFQAAQAGVGANWNWGDAFVAKFNSAGTPQWSTYYGGSDDEEGWCINIDSQGDVIVSGTTLSNNFPTLIPYQASYGGLGPTFFIVGDAFLLKFTNGGTRIWATYYGTSQGEWQTLCTIDKNDYIYILGEWETDGNNVGTFPATTCAYQKNYSNYEDQYFAKFTPGGTLVCFSYLGGSVEDDLDWRKGGIDWFNGSLYISTTTQGSYPVIGGSYQQTYGGGTYDAAIVKLCSQSCGDPAVVPLDFSASKTNLCKGDKINFNTIYNICDTTEITYEWTFSGSATLTSTLKNPSNVLYNTSGTFDVKLLLTTMCGKDSLTKTNYINVNDLNLDSLSTTNVDCNPGNNGTISSHISGSGSPYIYVWNTGATASTISGLSVGIYSFTVTDNAGCKDTASVSLINPSVPQVNLNSTSVLCNGGATGTVSVTVVPVSPPYTYSWGGMSNTSTSISGLTSGVYSITVTDANSCVSTKTISVTQPAAITGTISTTSVTCFGGTNGSASISSGGGTGIFSYLWNGSQTQQNITGLANGIYTVTVTDGNGCTFSQFVNVQQPAVVFVGLLPLNPKVCSGRAVTVSANAGGGTGALSYNWSNGQTNANIQLAPTIASSYTLIVTDGNGCTAVNTISVTVDNNSSSAANAQICLGENLTLPDGSVVNSAGVYTSTLASANGCDSIVTTTVNVNPSPLIIITSSGNNITIGQQVLLTASGSSGYLWTNGSTDQSISVVQSNPGIFIYCVTGTNANGCSDTACASINFEIPTCIGKVFVPTAFSPNADGANDKLCVEGIICIKTIHFTIVNRWGEKVFESEDPKVCWDGYYNGKPLDAAVFVYYLNALLYNGEELQLKGNISLVK